MARVRVFDRTEHNPVTVHLFGQIDCGLPADELRGWADADCTNEEIMARWGVFAKSSATANNLYPGLFSDGRGNWYATS